jgi:preprotein translocase subunit SecA
VDEEHHSANLTEAGIHEGEKLPGAQNLYHPDMLPVLHAEQQSLVTHTLKKPDVGG